MVVKRISCAGAGTLTIETPRDRDGSFEPLLIPKHARRFTGFDDKIVSMYARGMSVDPEIKFRWPMTVVPNSVSKKLSLIA